MCVATPCPARGPHPPSALARALVVVLLLFGVAACRRPTPPAPATQTQASSLPRLVIRDERKLLFTYFAPTANAFASTAKLAEIPAASRDWVRVVDLGLRPSQRHDHELVYVADLRAKRPDGTYPYVVLPRAAFEQLAPERARGRAPALAARAAPTTAPAPAARAPANPTPVVLYSTSWCGACRAARAWLREQGVPFVERDIERDPAASAELMRKAQAQGISPSGVPVLDVKGTLVEGFDPDRITALLGGRWT